MKKKILALICLILGVIFLFVACEGRQNADDGEVNVEETENPEENEAKKEYKTVVVDSKIVGSGGYGAAFNSKIDPFDENCLAFHCDMGCLYFSYDAGKSWQRHDVKGTFYTLKFDPTKNGVVWAGGSGVYKSTDHGKTIKMVFPKESEIKTSGNNYENINNWLYTDKESDYLPQYQIVSIAVNRKNSDNVFVGQRVPDGGMGNPAGIYIYHTKDGENFSYFTRLPYDYNFKLDYDESSDCLIVVTSDRFYEINSAGEIDYSAEHHVIMHHKTGNVLAFDSCYDEKTGNTFVFSTGDVDGTKYGENASHVATACYKTNDLRNESSYVDLMETLVTETVYDMGVELGVGRYDGLKSYQYYEWINDFVLHEFPWTIVNVSVLSDDVIYLNHEAVIVKSNGVTRRTIGYLKYDERKENPDRFKWVFGMPHISVDTIKNKSWQDGDSGYCFGLGSTLENEDALVFCTMTGVYYTPNGIDMYQCNSNIIEKDIVLTAIRSDGYEKEVKDVIATTTTGMDVYCTHRVETDPFDPKHILIGSTDFGLLQSFDGGESWIRLLREWSGDKVIYTNPIFRNSCYDLHFDREKKGIVYSLWSSKQTAPYAPATSYLESDCRFGISYDGGTSWSFTEITPGGKGIAYRMQVVYNGSDRIIYIATESNGFFVTYDAGKTFVEMNQGIDKSGYNNLNDAIFGNEIMSCKMGLFAVTGANASYKNDQKLYKWNEELKKFESIELPENIAAIRDIEYDEKNDCLYLAAIAKSLKNYSSLEKAGGGVWKYKDGEFTQIFDETISVFGVNIDRTGRLYATVLDGAIVRYDNNNTTYEVLMEGMFHRLKYISFGDTDDLLYVTTWGGGTYRIRLGEEEVK